MERQKFNALISYVVEAGLSAIPQPQYWKYYKIIDDRGFVIYLSNRDKQEMRSITALMTTAQRVSISDATIGSERITYQVFEYVHNQDKIETITATITQKKKEQGPDIFTMSDALSKENSSDAEIVSLKSGISYSVGEDFNMQDGIKSVIEERKKNIIEPKSKSIKEECKKFVKQQMA